MGSLPLSSSSPLILRHFFRPTQPPKPHSSLHSLFLFEQPFQTTSPRSFVASLSSRPLHFFHSLSSLPSLSLSSSPPHSLTYSNSDTQAHVKDDSEYDDEFESGNEDFEPEKETTSDRSERVLNSSHSTTEKELSSLNLPSLTVKEKKELASYAHGLGKKLKSQQVGKSGVTDSVATALIETLEANELLKLKIHGNCPGELDDVVKQLEEATGSVVVGRIGRTVILYRPSLSKLKAEEKKIQARKVFVKKQPAWKPSFQNEGPASWLSSRGRRGSSRF